MQKQKVFIPVDKKDLEWENDYDVLFLNEKNKGGEMKLVKEKEGYFFTEEEMQQFIKDSRNSLIHSVTKYIQSLNIK